MISKLILKRAKYSVNRSGNLASPACRCFVRGQNTRTKRRHKSRCELTSTALKELIFSSILFLTEGALGAGGDLLWPDRFDLAGYELWLDRFDLAGYDDDIDAMAADSKRVYVAGEPMNILGNEDIVVRALNAKTGEEEWFRQFDLAYLDDDANDLVVKNGKVFVAGALMRNVDDREAVVGALDANTGKVLWKRILKGDTDDKANAIAATKRQVFVVGEVETPYGDEDLVVVAFDSEKGQLQWRKQFDLAKLGLDDDSRDIAVKRNRVFVSGRSFTARGDRDAVVRALHVKTGEVLWEYVLDLEGGEDDPRVIAVQKKRVFVAGASETAWGDSDAIVLALNAKTGAEIWQKQFDLAGDDDEIKAMAVQGKRVFVAGVGKTANGDDDLLIAALNANTGEMLWHRRFDQAGGDDEAQSIAAQNQQVFIAGKSDTVAGHSDAIVAALDAKTGELLWKDFFDLAIGQDSADIVMTGTGSRIFVGGESETGPSDSYSDAIVRAFSTATGHMKMEQKR